MCYKGNCLYCIPVKDGCLVFAILSSIVTLVALLACLIVGVLLYTGIIVASNGIQSHPVVKLLMSREEKHAATDMATILKIAVSVGTFIACIPSLIAFICSVLLCNGICKRRPGQVKAYFIYGLVIIVVTVFASVIQMTTSEPKFGVMGLAGCVLYGLILWMVQETYMELRSGAVYKDHIRAVEI